MTNWDRHTSTP